MSSLLILGWTEEVPDFAKAVQPVQGVQPKIQLNRNSEEGPSCTAQRRGRTYNKDLPKWVDRLDRLDGANNDEHFSRPGSRRAPGRRSCLPGPRLSGAIILVFTGVPLVFTGVPFDVVVFVFYKFPFDIFGLFFYGFPFDVVEFILCGVLFRHG